jgi:hypothetical protein
MSGGHGGFPLRWTAYNLVVCFLLNDSDKSNNVTRSQSQSKGAS